MRLFKLFLEEEDNKMKWKHFVESLSQSLRSRGYNIANSEIDVNDHLDSVAITLQIGIRSYESYLHISSVTIENRGNWRCQVRVKDSQRKFQVPYSLEFEKDESTALEIAKKCHGYIIDMVLQNPEIVRSLYSVPEDIQELLLKQDFRNIRFIRDIKLDIKNKYKSGD